MSLCLCLCLDFSSLGHRTTPNIVTHAIEDAATRRELDEGNDWGLINVAVSLFVRLFADADDPQQGLRQITDPTCYT